MLPLRKLVQRYHALADNANRRRKFFAIFRAHIIVFGEIGFGNAFVCVTAFEVDPSWVGFFTCVFVNGRTFCGSHRMIEIQLVGGLVLIFLLHFQTPCFHRLYCRLVGRSFVG